MKITTSVCLLLAAACLAGCSRAPGPDTCKVEVLGIDSREMRPGVADVGYHVRGYAGGAGTVWVAAKRGKGDYLSGPGVEVGPGPFEAIVDLHLTELPPGYVVVLEAGSKRCMTKAPLP